MPADEGAVITFLQGGEREPAGARVNDFFPAVSRNNTNVSIAAAFLCQGSFEA